MKDFYRIETFSAIVRQLIKTAENKSVITYAELENLFGLSHNMAGYYAGVVGEYCLEQDEPLLNALIVNTRECKPSGGFDTYSARSGLSWGDNVAKCWAHYHIPTSREQQTRNIKGLTARIRAWEPTTPEHAD